jgi:hypothetical protein
MNSIYKTFFLSALSILLLASKSDNSSEYFDYVLNDGEEIALNKDLKQLADSGIELAVSHKSNAFDKSGYEFMKSKDDSIKLLHHRKGKTPNQSELEIFFSWGKARRTGDTIILDLESIADHHYLLPLKQKNAQEFGRHLTIKIVCRDFEDSIEIPRIDVGHNSSSIYALPVFVSRNELFRRRHKKNTIARFDWIELKDENGRVFTGSDGDYLILGGQHLVQE